MPSPIPDSEGKKTSNECFYLRADGTKGDDWIHEEILNNPEADAHFREGAIRRAVQRGDE